MSVQELIDILQQVEDKTARVWVFDSENGYIDITETFQDEKKNNFYIA